MMKLLLIFCFMLLNGVFGDDVIVTEGYSVTLEGNANEIKGADRLRWTFNGETTSIASYDTGSKQISLANGRYKDRLKLDHQTGSLTITNIRTEDSGLYQLEIYGASESYKNFNVAVKEITKWFLTEGDSVTLHTGVTGTQRDQVMWTFNDTIITLTDSTSTVTGDLIIKNIRRDQSGVYEVKSNNRSLILHKTFQINVSEPRQWTRWDIGLLAAVIVLVIIIIVLIVRYCKCCKNWLERRAQSRGAAETGVRDGRR